MFWRWCSITRMASLAVAIALLTATTGWAAGGGHGGGGGGGRSGFNGGGYGRGYGGYGYGRGYGGFGYGGYGYGRGYGSFGGQGYGGFSYGGYGYGRGYGSFGGQGYGGFGYGRGYYDGYGYGRGYDGGYGYGQGLYGYGYGLDYGPGPYGYGASSAYSLSGYVPDLAGYPASDVRGYYSPSRSAAASSAPGVPDTAVILNVRVPADAEIWVNETKTYLTGASREFVSPPLTPGQVGTYDVRARWEEDGRQVEQTRQVTVRAGDRLSINFLAPS